MATAASNRGLVLRPEGMMTGGSACVGVVSIALAALAIGLGISSRKWPIGAALGGASLLVGSVGCYLARRRVTPQGETGGMRSSELPAEGAGVRAASTAQREVAVAAQNEVASTGQAAVAEPAVDYNRAFFVFNDDRAKYAFFNCDLVHQIPLVDTVVVSADDQLSQRTLEAMAPDARNTLQQMRRSDRRIQPGIAFWMSAGRIFPEGNIKGIVHATGPRSKDKFALEQAYVQSIDQAARNGRVRSIAIPLFGIAASGYSVEEAVPMIIDAVEGIVKEAGGLEQVRFTVAPGDVTAVQALLEARYPAED
jgi:O-acetyl-ADP-ribose deacetylase (regulator of RNase III)